jgi:hypothetical protein
MAQSQPQRMGAELRALDAMPLKFDFRLKTD